ncbi:dephospho-CoA kinase [Phytohabitans houttuyneae]|uniref:Dephospho-CoA kinase n=1 Tax=Phytohabitans houttuyneae TaxID=1076126 RepID=A0A6V8K478_9ACTN|nr:dephospho-CoA kinase [Phytohabitans houttuyneae]
MIRTWWRDAPTDTPTNSLINRGTGEDESVLLIGLTGGIGAGKSAVAARLASHGATVVDSDRLAREVVAPGTEGLAEIVSAFGDGVLGADGALDRPALGARVFGDEEARRRLEGIIHPRVRQRSTALIAAAAPDAVVINDVPLLVEVGLAPTYHLVIVVDASEETRVQRLVRDRGMTPDQAYARIRAQVGDAERRAAADSLLRNDSSLDDLRTRVDALWHERLAPFEENVRLQRVPCPGASTSPEDYPRIAARLAHVLGTDSVSLDGGVVRVETDRAEALGPAGFPPLPDGRGHGSADPGRPARIAITGAGG